MEYRVENARMIKDYYGHIIRSRNDLKSGACCSTESQPAHIKHIADQLAPEIVDRFYGCGSAIPPLLDGCTVLDLGCGVGRDVFVVSRLIGEDGHVIGVDMTDEPIDVARQFVDFHMERFEFAKRNVEFLKGDMEDLRKIGIKDNSIDVVVSNCVINLCWDKKAVFSEIFRVLKPGGELYFSDIFADRRIPLRMRLEPDLLGECLAGALYLEDFRRIMREVGVVDFRTVSKRRTSVDGLSVESKLGDVNFHSATVRAFKLPSLEDTCEDYGQVARYLGTIPEQPYRFVLDDHHILYTNRPYPVCGNTASMLHETRYGRHFQIIGSRDEHYGLFPCGAVLNGKTAEHDSTGCGC